MKKFLVTLGVFCAATVSYAQNPWIYRDNPSWDRTWNDRPLPGSGACFFKDPGYRGDRFCVSRGDKLESLPGSFGDKISSIQLFGRARVAVFNDRGFRGGSQVFGGSVQDLRTRKFRDGHTWNDRISSLIVK